MNVLYIDHYAGSLEMGMEFRPFYFAREWIKMGHKVRIIGADYSHLRKMNPKVRRSFECQIIDGVEFQWIKCGQYSGNGIARAITMFRFCGSLLLNRSRLIQEFHPDIVISSSTYPLDAYPAFAISKKATARYIHEAHDLWPLTLIELGGMKKTNPFVLLLGIAERFAYKKAKRVIGVAPNEVEHMLSHGLRKKEQFVHIPNGIVLSDWESAEPLPQEHHTCFQQLKNQGAFIVCYLGGHALSNALDTLIDTAELSKEDSGIAYVLIGQGVEKERLREKAKGLTNVYFLPSVSKMQVPSALQEADALYVGAKPCSLYRYGISMNKVYDYMMAEKPVLFGIESYNNEVQEAGGGVTVAPENPRALLDGIRMLKNMTQEERRSLGRNGRQWVLKHCEYGGLAKRFFSAMIEDEV